MCLPHTWIDAETTNIESFQTMSSWTKSARKQKEIFLKGICQKESIKIMQYDQGSTYGLVWLGGGELGTRESEDGVLRKAGGAQANICTV